MVPAPAYMAFNSIHEKLYTQSLNSHALELKCEHQSNLVEVLAKDEDIRKLRIDIHILEDDYDDLRNLLTQEEDRCEKFEQLVNSNLLRAEDAEGQLQRLTEELRMRENELITLEAEKNALRHTTADATAALTEKLALTRELSVLKPELEHLKAQAASTEQLMTEKLALQRQLSEIQCEVENARREAKRALAKRRNTGVEIAQEEQMEDLRRQLAKEKRARARAEEAADVSQADLAVDDVRKELAREKRLRQKAEEKLEEAQSATQVEDVRKDLLQEKKLKEKLEDKVENLQIQIEKEKKAAARAAKRADGISNADDQVEELREELAKEKKARAAAEKKAETAREEAERAADHMKADQEAKKAASEKLDQFRNKLRTTKDKLKEVEAELELAKAAAERASTVKASTTAGSKASQKRNAAQMNADANTLGTPGDGPAAKRSRAAAGVGDKSTFSITPFLNKTTSVIGGSDDEATADASPAVTKARKPLGQQPASKSNVQKKASATRKPKAPQLEMVTEETNEDDVHAQGQENAASMKIRLKTGDEPEDAKKKAKARKRKSIHDFKSFAKEPEIKKKRKLGGLGKTLFDEDDDAPPTRALPGKNVFGSKGFGALSGSTMGKRAGGGLLGGGGPARLGSTLLEGGGSNFSPLKRSRRVNLDDTLRG